LEKKFFDATLLLALNCSRQFPSSDDDEDLSDILKELNYSKIV